MIKFLTAAICLLLTLSSSAAMYESIIHDAVKDRLVKKGTVRLTTKSPRSDSFSLEISYKLIVKMLLFKKTIEGKRSVELPNRYLTPYGYEELEEAGRMKGKEASFIHLGRVNLPNYYDCHIIKIIPNGPRKWSGVFTYCPAIASIGFARSEITISSVPWIGSHTVYSRIRD